MGNGLGWESLIGHQVEAILTVSLLNFLGSDPGLLRLGVCSALKCCDTYMFSAVTR